MKIQNFRLTSIRRGLALTSVALALTSSGFAYITILDESFVPGERTTQSLPDTSAWYSSRSSSSVSNPSTGNLTVSSGSSSTFLVTHFTDSAPISLEVGDWLQVSFNFSISGVTDSQGGLRIGLFDSGGSRVSEDGLGAAASIYNDYTGYAVLINPAGTTGQPSLRERDKTPNSTLITSTSPYSILGSAGTTNSALVSDYTYTGTFMVNYLAADVMDVSFEITDGSTTLLSLLREDTSAPFTSFDTFAIAGMTNAFDSITLDSFTVSAIPEPSTASMFAGSAAIFVVLLGRRKRR